MTPPLWILWTLPAVQLIAAGTVAYRWSWRSHPALICYLSSECLFQALALLHLSNRDVATSVQLAVRLCVLLEVVTYARIPISRDAFGIVAGAVVSACWWASGLWGWSHAYRLGAFRSYYLFAIFFAALSVTVYRWARPLRDIWRVRQRRGFELVCKTPECWRHKAYRVGVTCWLGIVALAGSTVAGSIGEWLLPYRTHQRALAIVGIAAYYGLTLTVAAMAAAMCLPVLRRRAVAQVADVWTKRSERLAA